MTHTYWSVYEYYTDAPKRRIYTFNTEEAAHDLVEFIVRNDFIEVNIKVEEYEVTT